MDTEVSGLDFFGEILTPIYEFKKFSKFLEK
jgi:hypothetical protein